MVSIKEKRIGKQTYYYLEHSVRKGKKSIKREKYLGKKLPRNIENLKKEFLSDMYNEIWFPLLNGIRKNYSKEIVQTPKAAKEKNLRAFAVRFTYDTQRIEGSKLTLRETANLLEKGITPKAPLADIKETEAHEKIFYGVLNYKKNLSLHAVLYWHKILFASTKSEIAGKLRKHQVMISGSKFTPPFPAEIYPLLREFFRWYEKNENKIHPVELAALAHLKFVTIHPFADGNGRISRLMMNFVLNRHRFPLFNIPYEKRTSYYNALEKAQIKKQKDNFVQWFFRRYIKEHKAYLRKYK